MRGEHQAGCVTSSDVRFATSLPLSAAMRLTSPPSRRVVWEDGMHLAPQHFQAQRRYQEDQTSRSFDLLVPFAYGLSAVALDTMTPEQLAAVSLGLQNCFGGLILGPKPNLYLFLESQTVKLPAGTTAGDVFTLAKILSVSA